MRIFTKLSILGLLGLLTCGGLVSSRLAPSQQQRLFPGNVPSQRQQRQQQNWDAAQNAARNETDNLIFVSVASLLQQWPNTLWRNGHTIVWGSIPVGTILYHARGDRHTPQFPEWTGTNVEHSYLLCPPDCWMLTLAVKEELNILYFDGSSAANSLMGHLDSQDILIWGEIRPEKCFTEWERLSLLCEWGAQYGLDGFVRMEPGFEVMLCDFQKKLSLVSALNIPGERPRPSGHDDPTKGVDPVLLYRQQRRRDPTPLPPRGPVDAETTTTPRVPPLPPLPLPTPGSPPKFPSRDPAPEPLPPHWQESTRESDSVNTEAILAAAWNSFYPGEVRVKLDYSRLFTFYDPTFTSLVRSRQGLSRNHHRLLHLSSADYHAAMAQIDEDFSRPTTEPSGIDWSAILRTVTDRYGDRIWLLMDTLEKRKQPSANVTEIASQARLQVLVMVTPYLVYRSISTNDRLSGDTEDKEWLQLVTSHCASSLTAGIRPSTLTRSERLIKQSVDGVLSRICSTLTGILGDALSSSIISDKKAGELLEVWGQRVGDLVSWLDWPMWHTCRPACPAQMYCYIYTWPFDVPWGDGDPDSIDMTPRCRDRYHGKLEFPPS